MSRRLVERLHPRRIPFLSEERYWDPSGFASDLERRWPGGSLREWGYLVCASHESIRRWTDPAGSTPALETYLRALAWTSQPLGAWLRPEALTRELTEERMR